MKPCDMLFCGRFAAARLQDYGYIEEAAHLNRVIGLYEAGTATYQALSDEVVIAWIIAKAHERGALGELTAA